MYKQCKNQQSIRRQAHIADCLLEMVSETAYADITVSALCERAEIPRKGFYRYFENKEDVAIYAMDRAMREGDLFAWREMKEQTPGAIPYLEQWFRYWRRQQKLFRLMNSGALNTAFMRQCLRYMGTDVQNISELDLTDRKVCRDLFVSSGMLAMLQTWHQSGCRLSDAEMAQRMRALLYEPMF